MNTREIVTAHKGTCEFQRDDRWCVTHESMKRGARSCGEFLDAVDLADDVALRVTPLGELSGEVDQAIFDNENLERCTHLEKGSRGDIWVCLACVAEVATTVVGRNLAATFDALADDRSNMPVRAAYRHCARIARGEVTT